MRPVLEDIFQNDPSIPLSTNQRYSVNIKPFIYFSNSDCTFFS